MIILFLNFIFMFLISVKFMINNMIIIIEWEILNCNSMNLIMTMIIDWITCLFLTIVLLISSAVMFFSDFYMEDEKFKSRFVMLILLFILSMMLLIISPNLITILLGWDGLGLVSYILVIYYQNTKSSAAGMLTVLTNRIGDVAFLLCIGWMLNHGNWNFFSLNNNLNEEMKLWVCFFMLLAAMTKSAQIPFSAWLPAAMAAPTPVSALVHSSTLVTAGVFLLIRLNNYLSSYILFNVSLMLFSSMTMLMASIVANYDYDVKKIIALSTLSQLGLMMSIISLNMTNMAFFHLITHALFKALLFICAGIMIHKFLHFQDIRMMGYMTFHLPIISICMNSANLALCGIPFMAGFYSKDMILEMMVSSNMNMISLIMLLLATGMTVMYTFRLMYFSFWNKMSMKSLNLSFYTNKLNNGALVLISGSVFGGSTIGWLSMDSSMVIYLPTHIKLITSLLILVGIWIGYMLSNKTLYLLKFKNYKMKSYNSSMWFYPEISGQSLIYFTMKYSANSYKADTNWMEMMSSLSMFNMLKVSSEMNEILQNNSLKLYLSIIMFPLGFYLIYF
uniref:NADH-ubiquinone oxidoreductase chain 5 n=1 Tax=Opisthopatus cinctipes TaxID=574546 RepID=D7QYU1_9BILA|nr:NADH dehydrogenase subunit 5 [Opisthopatus cinctipes]ADE05871.1 NADH dehydrogenase subunit 5 [Opisthopatus cinctipes]